MSRFEVGKRYGFMTDYMDMEGSYREWWDCTARTAQFVTLKDTHGNVRRYKVYNHSMGRETVYPDGCVLTSDCIQEERYHGEASDPGKTVHVRGDVRSAG